MAKSTRNRGGSKSGNQSGGGGKKVENAPSKTGNLSGRKRGNAAPRRKSK